MLLALDTYYFANMAKTVAILFHDWSDARVQQTYSEVLDGVADYEPGSFYKRELPCILSLLRQIDLSSISAIIIDGFVFLDDAGSPGLGAHLYQSLNGKIPVIGIAKTNFATVHTHKRALYRGESKRPLFISAIGMDVDKATANVQRMHGPHRIPTLLKELDGWTRQH